MGYNTYFTLAHNSKRDDITSDNEYIEDVLNGLQLHCKWYDHKEEMLKFSKQYPDILFILSGRGEEPDDLWKTFYKNGKCQHCKAKIAIIYDDFDEKKLK